MQAVNGQANSYPEGQCTRYADQRYHDLTGFFVPWSGNAKDWVSLATGYGWSTSSKPIVPSIVCLQAGVQGASSEFGHVAVCESIGKGTFVASNLNWGNTPSIVAQVTFTPGPGVSFIYATDAKGKALGSNSTTVVDAVKTAMSTGPVSITPNGDVTQLLWTFDQVLALKNPFTGIHAATDSVAGLTLTDPVSWVEGFGGNLIDDLSAGLIRLLFLIVGMVILLKVVSHFIDFGAIAKSVQGGLQTAGMVAALA